MSSRYTVAPRSREPVRAADYVYDLFRDGVHVGVYAHTFRGDEPRLELDRLGAYETEQLLQGGVKGPLELTEAGVALLDRLLGG